MKDILFDKRISHDFGGVDTCADRNMAQQEAVMVCQRVVREAADSMGASLKDNAVNVNLVQHTDKNRKNNTTGENGCTAHIVFDCKAVLVKQLH